MRDEIILDLLKQVNPSVPKRVLGTMPRISYHWSHPIGLLNLWKMREPYYLPESHKDYVCFGSRDYSTELHHGFSNRRGSPVCESCDKPFLYMFFYCIHCGEPFIRDFDDSRFCDYYPHCYDCLPELKWDYCKDHAVSVRTRAFQMTGEHTRMKPNGLNPRSYSEQEIADAFAFLRQ